MASSGGRLLRFEDLSPRSSFSSEARSSSDRLLLGKGRGPLSSFIDRIHRGYEVGYERIKSLKRPISFSFNSFGGSRNGKDSFSRKKTLNPQGHFLQNWNKIFLLACVIALALDPLFFYIPVVDGINKCIDLDDGMEMVACVLRTFIDVFYVLHMLFQFRTGFIAPSSRVFGRGELIDDPWTIAKRYLSSSFIIDLLAILPLPQLVILVVIPSLEDPVSLSTKEWLEYIVLIQYLPRIIRIFPLYREVTKTSGVITETAWAGAVLNLFLYMLASHVVGATWYLFSIEREDSCWHDANRLGNPRDLYCDKRGQSQKFNQTLVDLLNLHCPFIDPEDITNRTTFNFGIFHDALSSQVVEHKDFPKKFLYCFWWGLRSLSSLGQNLKTSTFVVEIMFAVCISIFGLILFASLIGNMQKYLQSTAVRVEEMRVKRRDAEQWMSHRMLPEDLRERVRRYEQYKWQETRGVEEEPLIRNLPKDLRRDIKRHLCLDLLKRVPMFEKMDEQLLDAMSGHLKPVLYPEESFIVREGDPVEEMLFIMRGNLVSITTNGGRTGFFNSVNLKAGDFCGEALLTWALDPQSSSHLPISTRTVQARTEVEAFALGADDLKFVATQFRRLHSKQIQHIFRFHSVQWKTWAVCFIQAAWRRHCKRRLLKSLREAEDKLQDALATESSSATSLGATIYASRFATIALRNMRQHGSHSTMLPLRLPLLPQKPVEPDFSSEGR